MEILVAEESWVVYRNAVLGKFNIHHGKVIGKPSSFPCAVVSVPLTDVNGIGVHNYFFYISDAKDLLRARRNHSQD
jgi:hypothetical protein